MILDCIFRLDSLEQNPILLDEAMHSAKKVKSLAYVAIIVAPRLNLLETRSSLLENSAKVL